jgi:hypothetical protein
MKSSFHILIPFLPSILVNSGLPSQETPSILSLPALDPRYIASERLQKKTPLPNNSSIVIVACLPRRCIETAVLLLLRGALFPRESVCRVIAQQWTSTLAPLFRLSGVTSHYLELQSVWWGMGTR